MRFKLYRLDDFSLTFISEKSFIFPKDIDNTDQADWYTSEIQDFCEKPEYLMISISLEYYDIYSRKRLGKNNLNKAIEQIFENLDDIFGEHGDIDVWFWNSEINTKPYVTSEVYEIDYHKLAYLDRYSKTTEIKLSYAYWPEL